MASDFYHAFEARFRGSRELIRKRLEVYLPFVERLRDSGMVPAADLGCGRGEWLELMQENGMQPQGVDLDEGMLSDCTKRNLPARKGDAIAYLESLPDESQAIVSGFHIAEHLPFERLQTLIFQALRVLRPGGLLILETPNAENISVGTLTFHMDPTHIHPLPPKLLAFLPEYSGFARTRILRLHENPELRLSSRAALIDVLQGVSPDYAIIAQKAAPAEFLEKFDPLFAMSTGLTLEELAHRFEIENQKRAQKYFDDKVQENERVLRSELAKLQSSFDEWRIAEEHSRSIIMKYQEKLDALHNSTSWKITAPFRTVMSFCPSRARRFLRRSLKAIWWLVTPWRIPARLRFIRERDRSLGHTHPAARKTTIKLRLFGVLRPIFAFALKKPALRRIGTRLLKPFPKFRNRLLRVLISSGAPNRRFPDAASDLSPAAKIILNRLTLRS